MEGMDFYPFLSTSLTLYVVLRWLVAIATAIVLLGLFRSRRYLFIKPSMQLVVLHHLLFQWPAATYAGYIENSLSPPWLLFWVLDFYIIACILLSAGFGARSGRRLFDGVVAIRGRGQGKPSWWIIGILLLVVVGISTVYLVNTSWTRTGLYAILFDPTDSAQVREDSLKLLGNRTIAYVFSIMRSAVAPLLVLVVLERLTVRGMRSLGLWVVSLSIIGVAMGCVALPGDRYAVVRLLLGILIWDWLRHGMRFRWRYASYAFLALVPAALLSLLREGEGLGAFWEYIRIIIVHRVWTSPLEVGTWYLDYSAQYGIIGIAAFPKLAQWLSVMPIDMPNVIGLSYTSGGSESVSAGAGFIFSYYAYIGVASPVICLFLTQVLDITLRVYQRLNRWLLVPAMVGVALALLSMVQGDFTVGLVSHGLIPVLILALGLSWLDQSFRVLSRALAALSKEQI